MNYTTCGKAWENKVSQHKQVRGISENFKVQQKPNC